MDVVSRGVDVDGVDEDPDLVQLIPCVELDNRKVDILVLPADLSVEEAPVALVSYAKKHTRSAKITAIRMILSFCAYARTPKVTMRI